jgi:hypothetical protein
MLVTGKIGGTSIFGDDHRYGKCPMMFGISALDSLSHFEEVTRGVFSD